MERNTKDAIIELKNICKDYDGKPVVKNVSFSIKRGEFVTFLGPSGCGKTTTLRMIAGFEKPTSGTIVFDGKDITSVPPHLRNVNTVFQKYALFPHLNVFNNIAFGLKEKRVPTGITYKDRKGNEYEKLRKLTKAEIKEKVDNALKLVDLEDYGHRNVNSLSGGQQQRVAIARALVNEPEVLLLDEPLGALDLKMRKDMQIELMNMHKKIGITFIYVTHDQEEALAISDRIAVMKDGKVMQVGRPEEIYRKPENLFVANFIGTTNQLPGKIIRSEDKNCDLLQINGELEMPIKTRRNFRGDVTATIRPEHVRFSESGVVGTVSSVTFLGGYISYEIELANGRCVCVNEYGNTEHIYRTGERVHLNFPEKCVAAYADTGEVVTL